MSIIGKTFDLVGLDVPDIAPPGSSDATHRRRDSWLGCGPLRKPPKSRGARRATKDSVVGRRGIDTCAATRGGH